MSTSAAAGDRYVDSSGRPAHIQRDADFANVTQVAAGTGLTTAGTTADQYTAADGLDVYINITSVAGTAPTLTLTIQGKDPLSGTYFPILTSAALNGAGFTHMQVASGIAVAANLTASMQMPPIWRLSWAIGGSAGQTVTCSISTTSLQ